MSAHLCPPMAISWKAKATHGRSMASLVVLKRYLWLNLTEMKGADMVPFVDFTVSPTGLFGPAVEGFAERFTATQKSSQAMRHFLPKYSNSAAASSRPKMAPTQQPAKAVPPAVQPAVRKRKGLRPALASVIPPSTPLSSECGRHNVCEKLCCEHWVFSHSAHTVNRCYSEKNKTQTYPKREHFCSSPYHEIGDRIVEQFNTLPHMPRSGRPSPECQTGFWG